MQIDLKDVHKRFEGGARALDGVSLHIPSRTRLALVGPNGSGKSTLIRAVMGLVRCDGVRLDGRDPIAHRVEVAARMAYVPQAAPLLGASVGDIVESVAALRRIDAADIRDVARRLRLDIDAVRSRPVRSLSGGMKQKLLVALAFAAPVSLYVMDEPTASLEAGAREAFFELFAERSGGATLVLSSHRLDEIERLVERVVALEDGRVVSDEPVSAWMERRERSSWVPAAAPREVHL
jgi:ABC-2 type transport system ATP-binding protein